MQHSPHGGAHWELYCLALDGCSVHLGQKVTTLEALISPVRKEAKLKGINVRCVEEQWQYVFELATKSALFARVWNCAVVLPGI